MKDKFLNLRRLLGNLKVAEKKEKSCNGRLWYYLEPRSPEDPFEICTCVECGYRRTTLPTDSDFYQNNQIIKTSSPSLEELEMIRREYQVLLQSYSEEDAIASLIEKYSIKNQENAR